MHPIPDFHELGKGRLVFPPDKNGVNRKPHPLDTVVRWADDRTWDAWGEVDSAPLWELVALHLYLDPAGLDRNRLQAVADREAPGEKSVATWFTYRLRKTLEHANTGNLASDIKKGPDAVVRVADFVEWCKVYGVPLPPRFPAVDFSVASAVEPAPSKENATIARPAALPTLAPVLEQHAVPAAPNAAATVPAVPVKRAPRRRPADQATTEPDYLRERDLLPLLRFSHATLWRKVKAGTFPAPVKPSTAITAWRRSDYEAWAAAQSANPKPKRKPRSR